MQVFMSYYLLIFGPYFSWISAKSITYESDHKYGNEIDEKGRLSFGRYFNAKTYNTYNEIKRYLKYLERKYPRMLSLIEQEKATYENRSMIIVKISGKGRHQRKPAIFMDAGLHAREWISVATLLYYIDLFVRYYQKDEIIRALVDQIDWYILPLANPDGYAYTHKNSRFRHWRKTRANCTGPADECCGVDLNRNFAFDWGKTGSTNNPCLETYGGKGPASEPETKFIQKFISDHRHKLRAYLTFHSYGQYMFYPYGHKENEYPSDVKKLKTTAEKAIANIKNYKYKTGSAATLIYPSSGGSDDWAKSTHNISFVYCVELPPTENDNREFDLSSAEIEPVASGFFEGLKVVAEAVIDEFKKASKYNFY